MRRHYIFYGSVQGVGFRWRAKMAAERFGVTGYVRNCYDGSVEMEIESSEADIDSTIMTIEGGHFISIENLEVKEIPEKNDRYFEIK